MLKIIDGQAWDFHEKVAHVVKTSRRGLRGNDLHAFIKRAGYDFAHALANTKLAEDEVPVHQIVVGATESFGPNRNGDGFPADVCRKYAHTFEKFGRIYRNHQNKDPNKSYGRIIKAAFYEPMQRIELLIGLNGSEKTAAANGGLVADKELDKLARGDELPFSMGCSVPNDRCSGCNNTARTKDDYCTESTCKYGGLRNNITKVADDGHILHAINDQPTFFDDSVVWRPADRTAYAFGKMLTKVASAVVSGAELASIENLTAPMELVLAMPESHILSQEARDTYKLACQMAREDDNWMKFAHVRAAFHPHTRGQTFLLPTIQTNDDLNHALAALAMHKIALPVREFISMILQDTANSDNIAPLVEAQLPGVFDRLLKSAAILQENPYSVMRAAPSQKWQNWAAKLAGDYSYSDSCVVRRMQLAALRNVEMPVKLASVHAPNCDTSCGEEKLAQQYALYQLGFLRALQRAGDPEFLKIASFTCSSNRVI